MSSFIKQDQTPPSGHSLFAILTSIVTQTSDYVENLTDTRDKCSKFGAGTALQRLKHAILSSYSLISFTLSLSCYSKETDL